MKENYLIGLANLVNGSMLGYEDKGNIEQYKKWITNYVKSLENGVRMTEKSADINYISKDLFPKTYNRTMIDDDYIKQLEQENKKLKEKNENLELNWEIIRQYCLDEQIPEESDEYNSYIEFSNSVYDNILNKMQELEGSDSDE